jgi:signal transduction histidine kinase
VTSRFVSTYSAQVLDRERTLAQSNLAAPEVTSESFGIMTASFGFQAALLLDDQGRVLQAVPADPSLIGKPIAGGYQHLTAALQGHTAISAVVRSAVERAPVVALATPFETPFGRRVFSGAYKVADTPLGAFLHDDITVGNAVLYLVDPSGTVVASSQDDDGAIQLLSATQPDLARAAVIAERGHFQDRGHDSYFVRRPVAGTSWSLLVAVPSAGLFSPLDSGRSVPWIILAVSAFLAAVSSWMTLRLVEARERRATEQAAALDRERNLVATLQQLSQAKRDFVDGVSHDLRTPLTSITGFLEMLQDGDAGPLDEHQAEMVDAVARNAARLTRLVEDLLTSARLDSDMAQSEQEMVEVSPLLRNVWADIAGMSVGRSLTFDLQVPSSVGVVLGQAHLLERVILNLLSNATKFTPDGGTITMQATADGNTLTVEVKDTGIGLAPEDQARLFQPFFRAAPSRDEIAGTGLGLVVVAGIVDQHHGAIEVDSVLGAGTTVRLRLPLATTGVPAAVTSRR